ncbi:MAG: hypothetical protein WDM81_01660 [Rhizomicrobium sp.]
MPEIKLIDDLDDLAADYRRRHGGREPSHVSALDPSPEFIRSLFDERSPPDPRCVFAKLGDPIPYTYSYILKRRLGGLGAIIRKLGFDADYVAAQIMENGTTAIAAVANWLKVTGTTKIVLLQPYYFAATAQH